MREAYKGKLTFWGKSLAWSIFLYIAATTLLDWSIKNSDKPIIVEVQYTPSTPIRIDASVQHGNEGATYSASKLITKISDVVSSLLD